MPNLGRKPLIVAAFVTAACFAQSDKPNAESAAAKKFYRLEFVVQEVEGGKVVNSRSFSMLMAAEHGRSAIRAGAKMPYSQGSPTNATVQYLDVGLNIDCGDAQEAQGYFSLNVSAEISNVAEQDKSLNGVPLLRSNRWDSRVTLPLKKATVIYASDDFSSKRNMRLQLTAVPVP
jgi:hypothetical protein